jgi:hypothetical protein
MASLAQASLDVPLSATAASEAFCQALAELGYTLQEGSVPGASEVIFDAKRTVLYTARQGGARITDKGDGTSTIEVGLNAAPGEATGLMDGKRNRKLLQEITDKVSANVGSA